MELYIEPKHAKRDTRYKKGVGNGINGWSTQDPDKRKQQLERLAEGRKNIWKTRRHDKSWNDVPVSVYDLDGNWVAVFQSYNDAARKLGVQRGNISTIVRDKKGRSGQYQFRRAEIVEFNGQKLVKKTPIGPYTRKGRWDDYNKKKKQESASSIVEEVKNPDMAAFFARNIRIPKDEKEKKDRFCKEILTSNGSKEIETYRLIIYHGENRCLKFAFANWEEACSRNECQLQTGEQGYWRFYCSGLRKYYEH